MVSENLKLVHACCKRFVNRGIEYDDLYGAGCLGLVKAVDGFKEELGFCFSTYAVPVILGEIKRLFRDGGSVKVSRSVKELSLKLIKEQSRLSLLLGREPSVSELAESVGVTSEEAAEALCSSVPPESLSYENDDGETSELEIGLTCSAEDEIFDKLAVSELLKRLDEKDKNLIELRYFANKTQCETASILSMTQVQVSRREKKLLRFMSQLL